MRASGIMVGIGDGVTVSVGDGVRLGEGVRLGVAVGPKRAFGGRLQALSNAISHNPKRVFLKVMPLLILVNDGAVNLIASSRERRYKDSVSPAFFGRPPISFQEERKGSP